MYEEAKRLFEEGDYRRSITLMELIIPAFRGRSGAEDLAFEFAEAHYLNKSYTLAAHYYKSFGETFSEIISASRSGLCFSNRCPSPATLASVG